MNGKKLRRHAAEQRREEHYRRRLAEARTSHDRAVIAWDRLRGSVARSPDADLEWSRVEEALDRLRCQIDTRSTAAHRASSTDPRPRVRQDD